MPTINMSHVALIEIILGVMIGILLVVVFLQWTKQRKARRLLAEEPKAKPVPAAPGASSRKIKQDLSFLADYIKELPNPKLMGALNAQTDARQIPPVLLNAMVRIFRAEQSAKTDPLIAEFCLH